ncbi:MAG TPA: glycosyltransferase [Sulfurimonas autotrophica]|nr:glycosyltransferase [Sulfurimonas autotrophica]
MSRKLLVVGSNSIHVYNFIELVKENFDEVLLLTNEINIEREVMALETDFSLGVQSFSTIKKIKKIVKDFQPSVIHIQQANTYAFLTVLAAKKQNVPLVLTAWGSDILLNPHKSFLLKKMLQYVLTRVQVVTADSDHVLNNAQKLVSKTLSVHNVNFGIFIDDCPTQKKENIIYSNRLHTDLYNIDKVIISFAQFIQNNKSWKLIIAGRGEKTKKLKELVQTLQLDSYVEFVGFLNKEDNYKYYCKSKIYISIPQSDSISISLVEAIICGCIPFVSNLDANLELIVNEKNGFIEHNLEAIAFSKFDNINPTYFEQTRKKVKVLFSKENNKKKYIEIYKKLGV